MAIRTLTAEERRGHVDAAHAARLGAAMSRILGTTAWTLEFWDGTTVAAKGEERFRVTIRDVAGLDRLLGAMPERGFGRAYGDGLIDVEPIDAFLEAATTTSVRQKAVAAPSLLRAAVALGARPRLQVLDGAEARLRGRRHSRERDASAVRHHYDVPVEFYRLWLDESLTYSCAYFEREDDDLATAQRAKLDLVCRKLRLRAGETLLDIGCGWGSLAIHAAERYGVRVVGITLSPSQVEVARERVAERGLADRVEIRLADYRDPLGEPFDAVASVGMVEHVGKAGLPAYARAVTSALRPGGRALIHGITSAFGGIQRGSFVDVFIFPDGELHPAGTLANVLEDAGLELRDVESLREHYAKTLAAWRSRLDARREEAERIVGRRRLRLWDLYLAGAELGFRTNMNAIHQLLLVRPDGAASGMPLTRADWYAENRG